MRALTIHEPYASLIILGYKIFETRSWLTHVRGEVAIHASKRPMDAEGIRLAEKYGIIPQYGKVLGVVDFVECWKYYPMYPVRFPTYHKVLVPSDGDEKKMIRTPITEFEMGDFSEGRYAWEFHVKEKFANPVPAKGQQGFWKWVA